MKFSRILSFIALIGVVLSGQTITGKVTDAVTGEALVGANVMIRHTFTGVATDRNGEFQLDNIPEEGVVAITMIGYKKQEKSYFVPPDLNLNIALKQDVLQTPQVIVTASRKAQDVLESPVSVSVITPLKIREQGAITLDEVLPLESGVSIVKDQLNIRGASGYTLGAGSRSLLLLDGVPLLGSAAGNITWEIVPTSEVEQVEIVKSGGSALYGSSAMGGVVNIITRNAPLNREYRFRTKTGMYSQPKYDQWHWRDSPGWITVNEFTASHPFGPHGAWLRVQQKWDGGYTQLGWSQSLNVTGKIKLNYGSAKTASLYGNYLTDHSGLESQWRNAASPFEAPSGSENDHGKGTKLNMNGFFNWVLSPRLGVKLIGSFYKVDWQNYGTNQDYSHERKQYAETQFSLAASPRTNIIFGSTIQPSQIHARIFGDHTGLTLAAYGLMQQKVTPPVSLNLGARYESFSVDGNTKGYKLAPQVAVNAVLMPGLALRSSLSTGFRSPTLAERYTHSQLSVFKVEPNPNLKPETSISGEIGGTWNLPSSGVFSGLNLDAALYQYRYENLIEPTPDSYGIIHFENVIRARITGADLSAGCSFLDQALQISLAYTWLNPAEVNASGQVMDTLSYRHRHHFVPTARLQLSHWSFSVDGRLASAIEKTQLFQYDPKTGSDPRTPVKVWNGSVGWKSERISILFRIENIFQYYYVELERNMGTERNAALSVIIRM